MKRVMATYATLLAISLIQTSLLASDSPLSAHIIMAKNVTAQMALARTALDRAYTTPVVDAVSRQQAIATAIGQLEIVRHYWPNQKNAVAESYQLEGELMRYAHLDQNAVDTLSRGVNDVPDDPRTSVLYRLLGESLDSIHRAAEAEQAFQKAERHSRFKDLPSDEREHTLLAAGLFYQKHNRRAEAAARYRAAADLPGVPPLRAATHLLRSADYDSTGSPANSRSDLKRLEKILNDLDLQNLTNPGEIETRKMLHSEVARLNKKLH